MKKIDVVRGIHRLIDAATEKFNKMCEEYDISPDEPRLTGDVDSEESLTGSGALEDTGDNTLNEMPTSEMTAGGMAGEMPSAPMSDMAPDGVGMPQIPAGVEPSANALPPEVPAEVPVEGVNPEEQPPQEPEQEEHAPRA